MRTDGPPAAENADGTSLSRRAFVVAGGSATGTVLGSGLATADRTAPVVAATAPYRPAVREAAGAVPVPIEVDSVGAAGDPPAVLVSGRPVPDDERVELRDVVVDGTAALRSPDGTWRDVVARSAVRRRWAAETSVETWSEYEGTEPLESVEEVRPDVDDRTATLVRGTRAYQYTEGRGGVGYYGVDQSAITDDLAGPARSVPVVRLAYVHARSGVDDAWVRDILDSYGASAVDAVDDGRVFVDPGVQ